MFLPEIDGYYTRGRLSKRKIIVRRLYGGTKRRNALEKKERKKQKQRVPDIVMC